MKILAVMVRYQTPLSESQTALGLSEALRSRPELADAYEVVIWDNSPEPLATAELPDHFAYRHSEYNGGVSGACNSAMRYAHDHGHEWMLLLDQDTGVTAEFLETMLRHCRESDGRSDVAAIAPTVRVGDRVVSPRRQLLNHHRAYPEGESGVASGEAFAINSGCLVRVRALEAIGGFNLDFWLDYSDVYVFHQLFLHGWKVWRAADAELQHDMSIMDYNRLMTPARYANLASAESAFNDLYRGKLENAVQNLRLFARAIKQRHKYENPEFSRLAWRQLIYRLTVPRKERIARWLQDGKERRERQLQQAEGEAVRR
jgi:GT2 family glycosyltransferase